MAQDKTCFRCGDPITFCECAAEYSELRQAFMEAHGREPSPQEMFALQPQTALERAHFGADATPPGESK
jgi:hypothetical protein